MLFRQLVDDDLGCACYLIGDEDAGAAAVVDPPFAIERLEEVAARHDVRIERVLETHTHADHLSGHGRLSLELGVPVAIHPAAEPAYPFEPLGDGDEVEVGSVRIRVLHTPGHRPEHCSFLVDDRLVLSGDSLLVGGAARPDLAVEAREGAAELYGSLRRLARLPDGVRLYPGHVAGSLCGAAIGAERSSTIGFERTHNPALADLRLEDFVAEAASICVPRPPNLARIVELNRGPFVAAAPPLEPLSSPEGAVVLDVRPPAEFAAGHVEGAINVPLERSGFATKAGFVLSPDERIALHASSPEEAADAARRLNAVGFLALAGRLEGAEATARFEPVSFDELDELLAADEIVLLDVREPDERGRAYIPGSRHVPYRLLRELGAPIDDGKPVVTICETGARAAIAASVLAAAGVAARPVLDGGIPDWQARGAQTVEFRRCGGA